MYMYVHEDEKLALYFLYQLYSVLGECQKSTVGSGASCAVTLLYVTVSWGFGALDIGHTVANIKI